MTVALPTGGIKYGEPRFIDRGAVLKGALGGDDQRLDRLGDKFGCDFVVKPVKADEARIWIARLIRGMKEKASIKFPQPGFVSEVSGAYATTGTHAANAVALTMTTAAGQNGKWFREGQFISILSSAGKRYLHQLTADSQVVAGAVTVLIQPPLRLTVNPGASVTVDLPVIEGYVTGDDFMWNVNDAKIYGLAFGIEEAA